MRHTIDVYRAGERKATTTDPSLKEVLRDLSTPTVESLFQMGYSLEITDNLTRQTDVINTAADYDELWETYMIQESNRREAIADGVLQEKLPLMTDSVYGKKPAPSIASAVNPKHHGNFVDDYGWLDVECRKPHFRNDPEAFIKAVRLQVDKYMARTGRKDDELQEFKKARFYLQYIIMFIENNKKPILAEDVHKFLGH